MYKVGDKVIIVDPIDSSSTQEGTIVLIEQDNNVDVAWLFILADDEKLNTEFDQRCGKYWIIREHDSDHVFLK